MAITVIGIIFRTLKNGRNLVCVFYSAQCVLFGLYVDLFLETTLGETNDEPVS